MRVRRDYDAAERGSPLQMRECETRLYKMRASLHNHASPDIADDAAHLRYRLTTTHWRRASCQK